MQEKYLIQNNLQNICMKKISAIICFTFIFINCIAQQAEEKEKEKKPFFKKENLFTGGSATFSFGSRVTVLGLSPYFGYSLNKYVDVAVSGNINYTSFRDYQIINDRLRQTIYGPGAFVRLYPVKFLFAQVQYEHNFIKYKYKPAPNNTVNNPIQKVDVNSLLVGGGYSLNRGVEGNTFYYFSVLWDVSGLPESPYVDNLQRSVPIVRVGINIGLFQNK
jgi:hypothetical protein